MGRSQPLNFFSTRSSLRQDKATLLKSGQAAVLALLPLLALTLWMWWNALAEVTQLARERFEFRVSEIQFATEQRLLAYEHVLRGGVGLFAAIDTVTRDEWHTYVHNLRIDQNYPGIQGIGFSTRVPPARRKEHIQQIRTEGFTDYSLWPAGERSEYTAIVFLEPFDWRNQRAFGYDMFSEPIRHAAMVRARDTGSPSVSGKVTLVQETGQAVQQGFLMYLPVYPQGTVPETVEARRAALVGYVYSPFRMHDLMQGILGRNKLPDIRLQIFDGTEISPGSLMYDSLQEESAGRQQASFSRSRLFEVNGQRWILHYQSLPAFDATLDRQRPLLLLISGLLVSALFAAVLWALSLNRRRAQELVVTNKGLQTEIVERKKLSIALEQAKNDAEAANRAKSEFMANVSHELRTPLTLILAPLDSLLAGESLPSDWRASLQRIQRNALLLLSRVTGILDFAKAEAGKFEPYREWVDLETWFAPLVSDAAAAAKLKGCTLTFDSDPALGNVWIDASHFENIVMNLVSNALKFSPENGFIRLELRRLGDDRFEFAVADSGPGIARDQQALLFQRFHQVNMAATRQHGGTGIGLALVKELTELMGGEVGVASEAGHGARFYVRLPHAPERITAPYETSEGQPALVPSAHDIQLRRARFQEGLEESAVTRSPDLPRADNAPVVLVVDDTPDMRDFITELLVGEFEVLTANDGLQAWRLLQEHHIDIVVSDVMMPELDGLGLTARIKASTTLSHLPVILVTARGGAEASVSGLESGADDYVTKPFSPDELKARVHSAMRMVQAQAQIREKSREAGMAMLATGILHNLGNALNGVTVSSGLIQDRLRDSKTPMLRKVVDLLQQHSADLPGFLARDPGGRMLPDFLAELNRHLQTEQAELLTEVEALREYTEHATDVVAAHQRFATAGAVQEMVSASTLMETALKLGLAAVDTQSIHIERHYRYSDALAVDRHKVLQILVNLLINACQALADSRQPDKRLRVGTVLEQGRVLFEVSDNGVGIDATGLQKLFGQGYTSKGRGHGFGLHLSANWAREMRGSLQGDSDGVGLGATFRLALPTR
jgi:signal transduction histidine kinase